jgi:hypothetical protein
MQRDVRTPREKVPPPRPAIEPLLLCSRAAPFFCGRSLSFHFSPAPSWAPHAPLPILFLCGSCIQAFGALSPRSASPSHSVLSSPPLTAAVVEAQRIAIGSRCCAVHAAHHLRVQAPAQRRATAKMAQAQKPRTTGTSRRISTRLA